MTYQVNPDGSVTVIKSTKEAIANASSWADYVADLKSNNSN